MSVILSKRKPSKYEALTFASEIQKELTDLAIRNFGVKDLWFIMRTNPSINVDAMDFEELEKEFRRTNWIMCELKKKIHNTSELLIEDLRSAYSRFPVNEHELQIRRDKLNNAIVECEIIRTELQYAVELFNVDLNCYERISKALDREISLIKTWRSKDNEIGNKFRTTER